MLVCSGLPSTLVIWNRLMEKHHVIVFTRHLLGIDYLRQTSMSLTTFLPAPGAEGKRACCCTYWERLPYRINASHCVRSTKELVARPIMATLSTSHRGAGFISEHSAYRGQETSASPCLNSANQLGPPRPPMISARRISSEL